MSPLQVWTLILADSSGTSSSVSSRMADPSSSLHTGMPPFVLTSHRCASICPHLTQVCTSLFSLHTDMHRFVLTSHRYAPVCPHFTQVHTVLSSLHTGTYWFVLTSHWYLPVCPHFTQVFTSLSSLYTWMYQFVLTSNKCVHRYKTDEMTMVLTVVIMQKTGQQKTERKKIVRWR